MEVRSEKQMERSQHKTSTLCTHCIVLPCNCCAARPSRLTTPGVCIIVSTSTVLHIEIYNILQPNEMNERFKFNIRFDVEKYSADFSHIVQYTCTVYSCTHRIPNTEMRERQK